MPVKRGHKGSRRAERAETFRKRVPDQPDGMPRGKHLAGFKGTKVDGVCMCGGCHPNAKIRTIWLP